VAPIADSARAGRADGLVAVGRTSPMSGCVAPGRGGGRHDREGFAFHVRKRRIRCLIYVIMKRARPGTGMSARLPDMSALPLVQDEHRPNADRRHCARFYDVACRSG